VVAISLLPFVPIKAANTSIIAQSRRTAVGLSKMEEQTLLMLCWRAFSRDGSDVDASIFGLRGSEYFGYVPQRTCHLLIIKLTRPKMVDTALTLISRMGQQACDYSCYLSKQPIQLLWEDLTIQLFVWRKCMHKVRLHSFDAQLNDKLIVSGCSTNECMNAYSCYWQPINRFYV